MKKAQGAQFNWIFVILAGGIILAFFVLFTAKFIDLQQQKANFLVAKNIENNIQILKTSSTDLYCESGADENCFSLGEKTRLEFYCQDDRNKIRINDKLDHELKGETVYAPSRLLTKDLDFWVKPWNYPFHISNFVFIAAPDSKFYIVFDQATSDFVNLLDIPVIFKMEKITSSKVNVVQPKSRVIFITASEPPASVVSALKLKKVTSSFINIEKKKLKFYDEEEKEIDYFGEVELLGSIFSDSTSNFLCNQIEGKKQLSQISKIYQQKSRLLSQFSSPSCFYIQIHNTLKQFLENPSEELKELLTNQNEDLISSGCKEVF